MNIASACWRDGLPICAALLQLVPPNWEHVAKQLSALEYYGAPEASLVTTRRVLWVELCGRVRQGELQAYGIPAGKKVLEEIPVGFLAAPALEFDVVSSAIALGGVIYNGVVFVTLLPSPEHVEGRPVRHSAWKIRQDYEQWVKTLGPGNEPTKRQVETWAKQNGYSPTVGRNLHRNLNARPRGRPRKEVRLQNGQE